MKVLIAIGLLSAGLASANECPVLHGTWQCEDDVIEVVQSTDANGLTEYQVSGRDQNFTVLTDGKRRKGHTDYDLYYSAKCDQQKVKIKIDGSYQGMPADLKMTGELSNGEMNLDVYGTVGGFPISRSASCQLK